MKLISVQSLGKSYKTYRTQWHRVASWFSLPVKPVREKWVLRNINFDVSSGEAIGLIGQNGAGKSTLLKMITGTLHPTEGQSLINGRISAILELGMGFNPELTGRQNAYHTASLMGFTTDSIDSVIDDIENFAEVGEYFDKAVRSYSSGMQMRVAFSVATAFRPEILIVDEAFAVGDTYFQHKSFSRIREFQKKGTTLLLVSHDRSAIQSLCNRAILLENGSIIKDGLPEETFDLYNALIAEKEESNTTIETRKLDDGSTQTNSGTGEATMTDITLHNSSGQETDTVFVGEEIEIRVKTQVLQDISSMVMGYAIKDRLGQVCYGTNTWHTEQVLNTPRKGETHTYHIHIPANFGIGTYSISIALHDQETHLSQNFFWRDLALVFNVINQNKVAFQGSSWLPQNVIINSNTSSD